MTVKIEAVRAEADGDYPRPWAVQQNGDRWDVRASNGWMVGFWHDRKEARAIVDAVNAIPPKKGKIEKFVVEMDPETMRRLTAVVGVIASCPVSDFWRAAKAFVEWDTSACIGDDHAVESAIKGFRIREDA